MSEHLYVVCKGCGFTQSITYLAEDKPEPAELVVVRYDRPRSDDNNQRRHDGVLRRPASRGDSHVRLRNSDRTGDYGVHIMPKLKPIGATKSCTRCKTVLPATAEFFNRRAERPSGLHSWCKTCCAEANKKWVAENRNQYLQYHRDKNVNRAEERRLYNAVYYLTHLDECRARSQRQRRDNPEAVRVYAQNRRARELNAVGSHTQIDIDAQRDRQKDKCFYCGKRLNGKYHIDHVVPLSLGGSNGPENIVIACPECNLSKSAKHPMDFAGLLF